MSAEGACNATTGIAPNRQFVVTWKQAYFYSGSSADTRLTFSIVLHETSNAATVLYANMTSASAPARADGNSATTGLQDSTGTSGVVWSFNTAVAGGLSNKGITFAPSCVQNGTGERSWLVA
jgi:hypothetical protein